MNSPLVMTLLRISEYDRGEFGSVCNADKLGKVPIPRHLFCSWSCISSHWRPGDRDPRLQGPDQRHRLMHRLGPALYAPTLFAAYLALLQVGKLPQVVNGVKISYLHEPGAHPFHHLTPGLEAPPPMRLPFEEVNRVEGVGAELEEAAKLSGRRRWPEGELLHERGVLVANERFQLVVEVGEIGLIGDGMKGGMIALVSLIFPDMD